MKTYRGYPRKTNTPSPTVDTSLVNNSQVSSARCQTPQLIQAQIGAKINTFINFQPDNFIKPQSRKSQRHKANKHKDIKIEQHNFVDALIKYAAQMKKKQQLKKRIHHNQNKILLQHQKTGTITQDQRYKFRRMNNPLQFLQLYKKSNIFIPERHQQILINKMIEIKVLMDSNDREVQLQQVLKEIYMFINMIVDFNQTRLLVVAVRLAADLCLEGRDFTKAVFFYNQARLASLYAGVAQISIHSLIGLAKVAYELNIPSYSAKFLKKALAFAWQQHDIDSQIQIYDMLGQTYCSQGKMQRAEYYHQRSLQNYTQPSNSAVRKIYIQVIKDDSKSRNLRLYGQNIDLLLLQTLNLPIYHFDEYPQQKIDGKQFENFIDGHSPRDRIDSRKFCWEQFKSADKQLRILNQSPQFIKQMPNPDVQNLYKPSNRYGKKRRDVSFNHTLQFHEITHTKIVVDYPQVAKKYSLQKKIQRLTAQKPNPNWYEEMSKRIKRERLQKLGDLKDPVRRSHLKSAQKRRSLSTQSQNMRNSINKAIISWIDPLNE